MHKWFLLAVLAGLVALTAGPAWAGGGDPPGLARKIVVASPDAVNEVVTTVSAVGGWEEHRFKTPDGNDIVVVYLPPPAIPAVTQIAGVLRVEDDAVVSALPAPPGKGKPTPTPAPSEPSEVTPWGVDRIDAEKAWGTSSGTGVKVAIIDTGIDQDHPDLVVNILGGQNFVGTGPAWRRTVDPNKWNDDNGHGTHVAGTVAAVDNDIGVIGVASGAGLLGVKVLDKNGSGYVSDVVAGIYWAVDTGGAQVINLSLGTSSDVQSLHDAVDYAYSKGAVLVAAAGNSGNSGGTGDSVIYPANYDSAIAVSATDSTNTRAWWSSTGPAVELAAPGVDIPSTWKDGGYNTISGTSMASPHVAGTAALVLGSGVTDGNGNGRVNDEVRGRLETTADDLGIAGKDTWYGYGLVDAQEATTGIQS